MLHNQKFSNLLFKYLGLKTPTWIDSAWGTLLEIFSFITENMSLLACDLCFDIGNPIMDNLEGQIPNFYVFQDTSHDEHCFASVLKDSFFSFPPLLRNTTET